MTQPQFDPLNPPNAAIGLRAGMFGDSSHCPNPTCGFASSDQSIYDCPSCGTTWRIRPKVVETPSGPAVGTLMALTCALCNGEFSAANPPVFDGSGLSHGECLAMNAPPPPPIEGADEYLSIINTKQPEDAPTAPRKKRRRRRKKKPTTQAQVAVQLELPDA